jgi:predicted O-methyltransferase YrrM
MYRSRQALKRRGYLDFFATRPSDAIPPDHADLWYLYQLVRKKKPQVIFEFGSGCSTVLLAQALADNARDSAAQRGFLYSLDVDEKWAQVTRDTIPEGLASFYEIRHAPVAIVHHKGIPAFRHHNVPQVPVDMIYLDSPPLTPDVRVAIDPLELESLFRPGFVMCVDGRKENVRYLRSYLQRSYRIHTSRVRGNTTFSLHA